MSVCLSVRPQWARHNLLGVGGVGDIPLRHTFFVSVTNMTDRQTDKHTQDKLNCNLNLTLNPP